MPENREQVIKGLECCGANSSCLGCPYINYLNNGCMDKLNADALALLKEQEEQVQIAHEEGFHDGYMQAMSEASQWISVKDRLPEKSGDVLVCSRGYCLPVSYSQRWKAFNASDYDDGTKHALNSVTHWMPLPEMPEEENDAT